MYSLKRIFQQEPNAVAGAIMAVVNMFVIIGTLDWTPETVAGVNTALVIVLQLFYVRPLSASTAALKELAT